MARTGGARETVLAIPLLAAAASFAALAPPAGAQGTRKADAPEDGHDWAQWRGPDRDGVSQETAWLADWPKLKIKKRWQQDIGVGYASVSVVGDRLYTLGYREGKDTVFCIDADTGRVQWGYAYESDKYALMNTGGPSATPSVVDGRVYTVSRGGVAHCFQADDGKVIWRIDLKASHGARVPQWGFSGSPLVRGDRVYIDVGVILCLDARNGAVVWKSKHYGSGYSSPVPFTQDGTDYLAVFPSDGLVILTEKDGKEVASFPWETRYDVNAATPVILGDGRIFVSSGYNTGCAMVRFDGKSLKQLWKNREMRNQMATSVLFEGHLYGFDDDRLACLDAETGALKWKERGLGKGALMLCQGKLIVIGGMGDLAIGDASPKGFKPAVRTKLLSSGDCWTVPVLSHGRLYCRDPQEGLICLDIGTPKKGKF